MRLTHTANSKTFYESCRFLARYLLRVFCRVHLIILEAPPGEGPCILASNHISHFEPALIGGFFPRLLDWVAMEELFHNPCSAWFLKKLHVIPVNRLGNNPLTNRQGLRTILERLKEGRAVGIFPEGGIRSQEGSILQGARMKPGVIFLSELAQAPVIPCVILGTDRLYLVKNWLRRPPLWMIVGKSITPPLRCDKDLKSARLHFEKTLSNAFLELHKDLCERFELTHEDLPQSAQERRGS